MRSRLVALSLLAAALGLMASSVAVAAPERAAMQQVIVTLHDDAGHPAAAAHDLARRHGAQLGFVYEHALRGFSAAVPAGRLGALSRDARVAAVELDQWATKAVTAAPVQAAPFGLLRSYDTGVVPEVLSNGSGSAVDVDVAVIDTGVDHTHGDLNVVSGTNCARRGPMNSTCKDGLPGDADGHGTHVAGTIGAKNDGQGITGVAPGARIHAVRVLGENGGYFSWIVAGIDWVKARGDIEVANLSLGCACSSAAMDTALSNLAASGVAIAVAAGNSSMDVKDYSPAGHPSVLTVSALADFDGAAGGTGAATCRPDEDDTLADFSNFGPDVDIIAPGVCIESTVPGGFDIYSGTSMASPHVAGALALLASAAPNDATKGFPAVTSHYAALTAGGSDAWSAIDDPDGTKEPLLNLTTVVALPDVPAFVTGGGGGGGGTDGGDGGDGGATFCERKPNHRNCR